MKKINEYKEGDRITLIHEGPGFQEYRGATIERVINNKNGLSWEIYAYGEHTKWSQYSDYEIQSLNSGGAVRKVFGSYDEAGKYYKSH